MSIKYSASAGGFFDTTINTTIPADAVDVSDEEHSALLAAQASGNQIQPDSSGNPQATTPPAQVLSTAIAASFALVESDRVIIRCYEHGVIVPTEWMTYRSTLRGLVSGSSSEPIPGRPAYPSGT